MLYLPTVHSHIAQETLIIALTEISHRHLLELRPLSHHLLERFICGYLGLDLIGEETCLSPFLHHIPLTIAQLSYSL
jgi:hypothetical protein